MIKKSVHKFILAVVGTLIVAGALNSYRHNAHGHRDRPETDAARAIFTQRISQPKNIIASSAPIKYSGPIEEIEEGATLPPPPASLRGTQPPLLSADSHGKLVLSDTLRFLFDYYSSASADESPTLIDRRIIAAIRSMLPISAQTQALEIFAQYRAYQVALQQFDAQQQPRAGHNTPDAHSYLQKLRNLRQSYFTAAVIEAFFDADDRIMDYQLAAMDAADNLPNRLKDDTKNNLPDTDKKNSPTIQSADTQEQLKYFESRLPASFGSIATASNYPQLIAARIEQLQLDGVDADTILQRSSAWVGPEAAARLLALANQRRVWQTKVDDYNTYRQQLATQGLPIADQQTALRQWTAQYFSDTEKLRLAAAANR